MIKVGTGVIVRRNNKLLVGRRKGSHGEGCLAFPGGHIDFEDSSFAEQAAREVNEEVGMEIELVNPDEGRQDLFTTFDILSEKHKYVTVYLLANYVSGGIEYEEDKFKPLEDKCEGWQFLTIDEIVKNMKSHDEAWIPRERLLFYRNIIEV